MRGCYVCHHMAYLYKKVLCLSRAEQDLEMVLVNMTKTKTRKSCKTKTKTKTFIFEENEKIVKKYIF